MSLAWRRCWAIGANRVMDTLLGRSPISHLPKLQEMMDWPGEKFDSYRTYRLRVLLHHCWDGSAFYRRRFEEVGANREAIQESPLEIFRSLPVLRRSELVKHEEELRIFPKKSMRVCATSGSSGTPVRVWQENRLAGWSRAVQMRAYLAHGVDPRESKLMLLSGGMGRTRAIRHALVDRLTRRRLFSFASLEAPSFEKWYRIIHEFRPSIIVAYPSVLHALCQFAERRGWTFEKAGVRLIHSQSEMLLDFHRDAIAKQFGSVPILNEYGCVEVGAMAYSCPQGRLHVSRDHVIMEVAQSETGGRIAEEGEGSIVLTVLESRGMPLLRYDVGDAGILIQADCPCGRFPQGRILDQLLGRTFEKILDQDGQEFSAGMVHFFVKEARLLPHLREYRVIQKKQGLLEFKVVWRGDPPEDGIESLREAVRRKLSSRFVIKLTSVDRLPRQTKHKASYFQSLIQ